MPQLPMDEPTIEQDGRGSLVVFAIQVWLHRTLAELSGDDPDRATGSAAKAVSALTDDPDRRLELGRGLDALRKARSLAAWAKVPHREAVLAESFVRALDHHLVRSNPREREAHLRSFFVGQGLILSNDYELVDPAGLASAWAAGPSRSKAEVLDRGWRAAALAQQLGDRFPAALGNPARPRSPYERDRTLGDLVRLTCRELIGLACLPTTSGSGEATRLLALVGEEALRQLEDALFGQPSNDRVGLQLMFGSAAAWRLTRVLTKVGELAGQPDAAVAVWGRNRSREVPKEARRLLQRIIEEEPPNINRPRSFTIEAYRSLGGDPKVEALMWARLALGRTALLEDGVAFDAPPFAESGLLSGREQAYLGFVLAEQHPDRADEVVALLRGPFEKKAYPSVTNMLVGARHYAAAYIGYGPQPGTPPPLAAFEFGEEASPQVTDWFESGGTLDSGYRPVADPVRLVWEALRTEADENPVLWTRSRPNRRRRPATSEVNEPTVASILQSVPMHARLQARSLVVKALLTIDGTARRDAIESLRQAGLADVAASLIERVVLACEALPVDRSTEEGAEIDWVREQATFCLSYTGSMRGFDTLARQAGLVSGGTGPHWLPQPDEAEPSERWIRTVALLGLADLGDRLHDAEDDLADARIDLLLDRIELRLAKLARSPFVQSKRDEEHRGRPVRDLWYLERSGEVRALTAVLAMLRSPKERSVQLLHVLSGRCFELPHGDEEGEASRPADEASEREALRDRGLPYRWRDARPPNLHDVTGTDRPLDPRAMDAEAWSRLMRHRFEGIARLWDLPAWQLAEWGAARIERRFRAVEPGESVVRITDPFEASVAAEHRMRRLSGQGWKPTRVATLSK